MKLPFDTPPDQWNEDQFDQLRQEGVPEHERLDYKRELLLDPVKERRELLKDITAMANSGGGVIIYGIEETKHPELGTVAGRLCPMTDATLIDRANRICRSSISPPITFHLHFCPTADKSGFYIVAEVPQSPYRPHAFTWNKHAYWYARHGQDNFPMTEPEIRELYRQKLLTEQGLSARFNSMDRSMPGSARSQLVCLPHMVGLQLFDTLTVTGRDLCHDKYINFFGGSNGLNPKVDRFEEIKDELSGVKCVRIFSDGGFLFGHSPRPYRGDEETIGAVHLYFQWYKVMVYLHELYSKYNYFGRLRVWLALETPGASKLTFAFERDGRKPFHSSHGPYIVAYRDVNVEELARPYSLCEAFLRLSAQACGVDLDPSYVESLRPQT